MPSMHTAHGRTHSEQQVPWYPEWTKDAACRGENPEMFFPKGNERDRLEARKVCWRCPVRTKCLRMNLRVPYGIFGGYTEMERYRMLYPGQDDPHKRFGSSFFGDFYSVSRKPSSSAKPADHSQEQLLKQLSSALSGS